MHQEQIRKKFNSFFLNEFIEATSLSRRNVLLRLWKSKYMDDTVQQIPKIQDEVLIRKIGEELSKLSKRGIKNGC